MLSRKNFIKKAGVASGMILFGSFPFRSLAQEKLCKLTILHTNDTQSQIEPFAIDAPNFAGLGGLQARADLLQKIRSEEAHVLLLDTGDFFHGSPYFDLYKGAVEIEAMNLMKYDVACIGEHEFDAGIENLAEQLSKASFQTVCANYEFGESSLTNKIKPYVILNKGAIRIGIFGIGVELKGLTSEDTSNKITILNPIEKANEIAQKLKKKEHCDFVICLSHLGLNESPNNKFNDQLLAKETQNIDLIVGGHSHTLLRKPLKFYNKGKQEVLMVQSGWGGVHLGRIDYVFSVQKNILSSNAQTVEIGK
jgi:5'-nucleotidase